MDLPLIVIDEAADVLARSPEARALVNRLLLAGRKNGIQEQPDPETGPGAALRHWQYPTPAALEAAARQR
ncbi:hypothetical protein [Streptomyces aureoverticillatus]|uniref:hypothetical protein n=1 Tax=Streptomyces aureoverticillatus TaxID=66871 RepID=UPI0013DC52DE|nr:hypothetical protein [Streptomyces aureoverticillatus]QIB49503.1 hypothetical protein G3H79_40750 [Streptomyces aureoverticillatus]